MWSYAQILQLKLGNVRLWTVALKGDGFLLAEYKFVLRVKIFFTDLTLCFADYKVTELRKLLSTNLDQTKAFKGTTLVTLRAKLSGAVYCNRSCLCVCGFVAVFMCLFVGLLPRYLEIACIDFHQTGFVGKGSDHLQLIKFWPSCAPGKGSAAGRKFLAPPCYSQRAVFASLWALFHICIAIQKNNPICRQL